MILLKNQIDAYLEQNCHAIYKKLYDHGLKIKLKGFHNKNDSTLMGFDIHLQVVQTQTRWVSEMDDLHRFRHPTKYSERNPVYYERENSEVVRNERIDRSGVDD